MAQIKNLPDGYWHDMKVTQCDMCGATHSVEDSATMLYDISIFAAEGFDADTPTEREILIDLEDCCIACARSVWNAIEQLRHKHRSKT